MKLKCDACGKWRDVLEMILMLFDPPEVWCKHHRHRLFK